MCLWLNKAFFFKKNLYFLFFRPECYIYIFPRWTSEYFLQEMRAKSNTIFLLQPRSFPEEFWIQYERQDLSKGGMQHMWERLYWRPLIFLTQKVRDKISIKKFQSGPFWLMVVFFLSSFLFFFSQANPLLFMFLPQILSLPPQFYRKNTEGKWYSFISCFSAPGYFPVVTSKWQK